jgi:high-affinity iron transporter
VVASFLIVLREGFEATLLVAIVLAYLVKIGRGNERRGVWYGVAAAAALSVLAGAAMFAVSGSLKGDAGEIFKGAAMWTAVAVLTYMILWMRRQSRTIAADLRRGVDEAVKTGSVFALGLLAFVMVFREGLETALFMFSITQTSSPAQVAIGGVLGLVCAIVLGYLVYVGGRRLNLGAFFKVTGLLLIVVAAGLFAHGMAMFQSASLIPAFFYPLWDLTHVTTLTHESYVGQFLIAFLGWDPKPDLLEFGLWLGYLLVVGYLFLKPQRAEPARAEESSAAQAAN